MHQQFTQQNTLSKLKRENDIIRNRFAECNQSFNSIFDYTTDGVALLNLQLDFFKTNRKFCDILGYTSEKILMWNLEHIVPLSSFSSYKIGINQLTTGKSDSYQFKKKFIKKSGEVVWLYISITLIHDSAKQPHYFIMYIHNLTSQKLAEDHLSYLTLHDPLTKLSNRYQFEQFANKLLRDQNPQKKFNLLLIDIDGFKNINNTIGYESGNLLLQTVAKRLKTLISRVDLLARLNSDEFVFITTENISMESIHVFSEKILIEISKSISIKRHELYITASIGISIYPQDGFTVRKLMKHADIALHYAKEQGKNNYQFYSIEMSRKEKLKLKAQNILAHALIDNSFYLQYQPRYKTINQELVSIEVFLCLQEDRHTTLTLKEMLLLTKDMGLSLAIMDWTIKQACKQLKIWQNTISSDIHLTIHCEMEQVKHPYWAEKILKMVEKLDVSPHSLALEIAGMLPVYLSENNNNYIFNIFTMLKNVGVNIILGDAGVDSLSSEFMAKLYFDKIKIHPQWIKQLLSDETSAEMIMAIISKAKKSGIEVIAENVENKEQVKFLKNIGCSEFQGDFFMAPLSQEAMTDYLQYIKEPVDVL